MKKITKVTLDTTDLPSKGGDRSFTINGEVGAVFTIYAYNEDGNYYCFSDQTFRALDHTVFARSLAFSDFFLTAMIGVSGSYSGRFKMPTVTDDDIYEVYVRAEPGIEGIIGENNALERGPGETRFDESFDHNFIYHVPNNNAEIYTIEDQM